MTLKTLSNKWAGMGILSAIAASLCCITPLLAILAGSSGLASSFSWMEPLRPYLIGFTVLVIGFAWYQKLKPQATEDEEADCNCEEDTRTSFLQTKTFLGLVTIFAGLMLAFPYYSKAFYPQSPQSTTINFQENATQILVLNIQGMTCTGCEAHIEHAANEVQGIQKAKASYVKGIAEIEFDPTQTAPEKIIEAVKTTGYEITDSDISYIDNK